MAKLSQAFTFVAAFAVCMAFIMAPAASQAQDVRIGMVDAGEVLGEMPELTEVQDQLEGFANRKRREFAQMESQFVQAREEFEQKVAVISENARENEQQRLAEMAAELQQFQQEYQEELMMRQEQLISPLRDRIMRTINEVADEMDLAYVVNRMVNNGDMVVLYASDEMRNNFDITGEVKSRLGVR